MADLQSCDMSRAFWLIYFNPNKHPDRPRFVGAFDTRAGAEQAAIESRRDNKTVDYRVVSRPESGDLEGVRK